MSSSSLAARENMLKSQVTTGNVLEPRILDALFNVAREQSVPTALSGTAYVDDELPLGNGRFLMAPLQFAALLKHAAIAPHETVLDVGCAAGYSAAVVARLARRVVALEEDELLSTYARAFLAPYPNAALVKGPLTGGVSKEAPYDAILIEGAVEVIPPALADQLREGGRLLAVEHDVAAKVAAAGLGKLALWRKVRGILYKSVLGDASVPLLASFARASSFSL